MFCYQCGAELPQWARFCWRCGAAAPEAAAGEGSELWPASDGIVLWSTDDGAGTIVARVNRNESLRSSGRGERHYAVTLLDGRSGYVLADAVVSPGAPAAPAPTVALDA